MRDVYNFTTAGFRNARQHGITPVEVYEVIDSDTRLFSRRGTQSMLVLGTTDAGRHVIVLVTESDLEPDVWDVVAARELTEQEISSYRKVRGGNDE